jgi:hypothetical protein
VLTGHIWSPTAEGVYLEAVEIVIWWFLWGLRTAVGWFGRCYRGNGGGKHIGITPRELLHLKLRSHYMGVPWPSWGD